MQMDAQSFFALQPGSYSGLRHKLKSYPNICLPFTAYSKCLTGNLILDDIIEQTLRLICSALLRFNFYIIIIIILVSKYGGLVMSTSVKYTFGCLIKSVCYCITQPNIWTYEKLCIPVTSKLDLSPSLITLLELFLLLVHFQSSGKRNCCLNGFEINACL